MKTHLVAAAFTVALALVFQASAADQSKAATTTNKSTAASSPTDSPVVARVNGTEISRKELDAAVQALTMQMMRSGRGIPQGRAATMEHDVLDQMINRELLLQEGSQHVAPDLDKRVAAQLDQMKMQIGGEEQMAKALSENGITLADYTKQVRENLIVRDDVEAAVDKEVKITPDDVKAFYDKNPDQFKRPEEVCASHILIRVPADATDEVKKEKRAQIDAARSLIKGGEKFADVAKKFSEDPGSAVKGGDLGCFGRGQMVPEFDQAAFSLKTNEVSDVVTTQYGYHILIVTGRKPAGTIPFDEVKEDLAKYLKQRKGSEIAKTHVEALRKTAKVDVLLPAAPAASSSVDTPTVPAPAK